jgi:RHS repeat-associated protein
MLVVQERDGNNVPLATYTRGRDLSGGLQGAGGIGGLLARTENGKLITGNASAAHAYYQADAGGNVTCLLDAQNAVVARYQYDPFGNLLGLAGPLAEANLYRFSAKEFHANSGLYYYGYRFYEPRLQRWLNADPIGEAGGVNLYAFVDNNPVAKLDPSGLDFATFCGAGPCYSKWLRDPPTDPICVAREYIGKLDYNTFSPFTSPSWIGKNKCNKFVGDCISKCPSRPNPRIRDPESGKLRYPLAREWNNPNVSIPGYGPPHKGPKPGDVVTDGIHVGFMASDGYIEASSYGAVKLLPFGNPLWNPDFGRSPEPQGTPPPTNQPVEPKPQQ